MFTPRDDEHVNDPDSSGKQYHAALDHGIYPVRSNMEDSTDEENTKTPASSFYGNNITINLLKADLAKKATACAIADCLCLGD